MNRIISSLASVALGANLFLTALNVDAAASSCAATVATENSVQTLYAGQTTPAGIVTMEVVGSNLEITYQTTGGWQLTEAHVWVGTNISDMPQTRQGNPKIGNFPYQAVNLNGAASWSVSIPLSVLQFYCNDLPDEGEKTYYVAAHAAVQQVGSDGSILRTETAWSDGDRFVEKGMWGTRSTMPLTCSCDTVVPPTTGGRCETAFAYSRGTNAMDGDITTSFLDIDEDKNGTKDFNRWGWSNGAVGDGTYTWDIYAGAGQSDITKGTRVGTLAVDYDGTSAVVVYQLDVDSPYYMEESHLYVGNEILPRNKQGDFTVAPGQYPTIHDTLKDATKEDMYSVTGLSGGVYVVAHATVCGFPD